MQRSKIFIRFLKFFSQATTQYGIHSPFVFEFTQKIVDDNRQFYAFPALETLRAYLLKDTRKIEVTDFGAGSRLQLGNQRSVKSIAKSSLTSPLYCQMLFRMLLLYKPQTVLEMGTSLGLSTLYLSMGASSSTIITLEGCPNIAQVARENFRRLEAKNITIKTGHFDQTLSPTLNNLESLDFAFIDGNHRKAPTLSYFEQCLEKMHEQSILVFDDIHWSDEMEAAWESIKKHPEVTTTIDLFFMGVVFLRKDFKEQQHFKIVPKKWKPWIMGFFGSGRV